MLERLSTVVNAVRGEGQAPARFVVVGDGGPWIRQRAGWVARAEDELVEVLDSDPANENLDALAHTVVRSARDSKTSAKTVGEPLESQGTGRSGNLGVCWIGQGFVNCLLSAAAHTPSRHPMTNRTPRLESCRERSGPKPLPSGDGTSP